MNYDERGASVRRARMAHGLGDMELAQRLEAEGWKYDPPKPVLPVVSAPACQAFYSAREAEGGTLTNALRAAFKVIALDAMKQRGWQPDTAITFYRARDLYRALTGEEWTR